MNSVRSENIVALCDIDENYLAEAAKAFPQARKQEWIHACKTGEPTLCNFDYSGMLIEHNLLGNVAYRAGAKLQWDPQTLTASNCPEASQFIRRDYRCGWTL